MAWTTPRTWVRGDLPTVTRLNVDLRDNMVFLAATLGVRARASASQTGIATGVQTQVTPFDVEDFDSDNMHNQVSNTGRLTVVTAGKYMVGATIQWNQVGASTTQKRAHLFVNRGGSDTELARTAARSKGAAENMISRCLSIHDCLVGDYFRVEVFQDSGSSGTAQQIGKVSPMLWAYRIGA